MKSGWLLFCVLALAACDAGQPAGDSANAGGLVDPARIDATLAGYVERSELVGVSALVYEKGDEAYFGAFGLADREAGRPLARDSLVRIFSMTKPITGVVLMTFYEEGRFELDDPLERYLPEFAGIEVYAGEEDGDVRLEAPARPPTVREARGVPHDVAHGWANSSKVPTCPLLPQLGCGFHERGFQRTP